MKEETIRKIAREKGMRDDDLFVKFIQKRFPDELSEAYVSEWADRFLSCNPATYMDGESLKIYINLVAPGKCTWVV